MNKNKYYAVYSAKTYVRLSRLFSTFQETQKVFETLKEETDDGVIIQSVFA